MIQMVWIRVSGQKALVGTRKFVSEVGVSAFMWGEELMHRALQKPYPHPRDGRRSQSRALVDQDAFGASARSADEEEAAGLAELVGDGLAGTRVGAHAHPFRG